MVHRARPLTTSRNSLMTKGRTGDRLGATKSGERKEYILQSSRGFSALRAKLVERSDTANPAIREQHEAVADTFSVHQLVDGENEGTPPASHLAKHPHDLAGLPEIE